MPALWLAITPISGIFGFLGVPRVVTYGVFLIMLFFYVIDRVYTLREARDHGIDIIFFYCIVAPMVLIGIVRFWEYFSNESAAYVIIIFMLPAYFMVRTTNTRSLVSAIRIASYITLLYYYPQPLIEQLDVQYMEYGYWIEFSLCAICAFALKKRKPFDIALSVYGFASLLVFGCRGALIGTVLFLLFFYLKNGFTIAKAGLALAVTGVSAALLANIQSLYTALQGMGIQSRTLRLMIEGEFSSSNGRDVLYERCREIVDSTFIPGGPLSSRALLKGYPYPHSFLYELQIDFGMVVGTVLFLAIVGIALYMLIKAADWDHYCLAALFFIVGLTMLSMSSSLYHQIYIPGGLALFVSFRRFLRHSNGNSVKSPRRSQ